jgi:hypothetical protein
MPNRRRRIKVDKRAAAKRQTETAIRIWFSRSPDPVSVHSLAANANEILHGIAKHRRLQWRSFDTWVRLLPQPLQDRLRFPRNFFKHANTDVDRVCDYLPFHGELLLFDATESYDELFGATPLMDCFMFRFVTENRRFFPLWAGAIRQAGFRAKNILSPSRGKFLENYLPLAKAKRKGQFVIGQYQLP